MYLRAQGAVEIFFQLNREENGLVKMMLLFFEMVPSVFP